MIKPSIVQNDELFRAQTQHTYPSITLLRVMGALAVICLHCTGLIFPSEVVVFSLSWWVFHFFQFSCSWAVTCFVMASGAVLLRRPHESYKKWLQRRFYRVGIPGLFWLTFYGLYFWYNRGDVLSFSTISHRLLFGPVGHLHFIFIIVGLYIIAPLLNAISHHLSRKEFFGVTCLFLFISISIPTSETTIQYFIPFIGYFMLGSFLITSPEPPSSRFTLFTILIASFMFTLSEGFLHPFGGVRSLALTKNIHVLSIFTGLISVAVFILTMNASFIEWIHTKIGEKNLAELSAASFGMYLVHPVIISELFITLKENSSIKNADWMIALVFIPLTYCISLCVVKLLRSNSVTKILVGG